MNHSKIIQLNHLFCIILVLVLVGCSNEKSTLFPEKKIDKDWLFFQGDIKHDAAINSDTIQWREIDLPHDWSIEGEYRPDYGTDWQSGFLPAGIGWYRKDFEYKPAWKGKRVSVYFEGIYLNSDVWINGQHLGHRPNGYISFEYDLTPHLKEGKNVIVVKADHSKPLTGRWYTGSGIYRHVWLKVRNPVHIPTWGIRFTTKKIEGNTYAYEAEVTIKNLSAQEEEFNVKIELRNPEGNMVSTKENTIKIPEGIDKQINFSETLDHVFLWHPRQPDLYTLNAYVYSGSKLSDKQSLKVGFRSLEFNPDSGFLLNGEPTVLKGVCDHHTAGCVGSAIPDDVLRYRLTLLKEMGCNAIRTAHNPFSPTFYDLCDELGLMVMNEFLDGWEQEKAIHDYGLYFEEWWKIDARAFILRDRNHPSVIMWSIGNEVRKATLETQQQLIDFFHELDPGRPVTQGGKSPSRDEGEPDLLLQLDIAGYNGQGEEKGVFEKHHSEYPEQVIVGTEIPHTYQTRSVYRTNTHWRVRDFPAMWEIKASRAGKIGDLLSRAFVPEPLTEDEVFTHEITTQYYKNGSYFPIENDAKWAKQLYYQSSYDNAIVRANVRKTWQRVQDLPYVIGMFRWGSFDYLGETNDWPSRFGNFGVIDISGIPKDHFYLYQSLWTEKPMVHILPHWTHPGKEGVEIPVVAYTNCDEVELFLNGHSLGTRQYQGEQLVWHVPYEKGKIEAVGRKGGKEAARSGHITAGEPYGIKLHADKEKIRSNGTGVIHVTVEIIDRKGNLCPLADLPITFELKGPAKIIGTDNGDPLDLSSYKTNNRRTFRGKAMLLLQAGEEEGEVIVTGHSEGLESGNVVISCGEGNE